MSEQLPLYEMPELNAEDCFMYDDFHTAVPNEWLLQLAKFKVHYDTVRNLTKENEDE